MTVTHILIYKSLTAIKAQHFSPKFQPFSNNKLILGLNFFLNQFV